MDADLPYANFKTSQKPLIDIIHVFVDQASDRSYWLCFFKEALHWQQILNQENIRNYVSEY